MERREEILDPYTPAAQAGASEPPRPGEEGVPGVDALAGCTFRHPREVLAHPALAKVEKRAILAAWASDARAVPSCPALRRLPGEGATVVLVDDVLAALAALDAADEGAAATRPVSRRSIRPVGRVIRWRPDEDDDPPPSPVPALPPRPPAPILDAVAA
jgi:hypothetical protein